MTTTTTSPTSAALIGTAIALFAAVLPARVDAQLSSVIVRIEVASTKADGSPWDALGSAPDIVLCVARPGAIERCEPVQGNTYIGFFENVVWEPGSTVRLVDADPLGANDPIGSGVCPADGDCVIGQATITISLPLVEPPPVPLAEVARSCVPSGAPGRGVRTGEIRALVGLLVSETGNACSFAPGLFAEALACVTGSEGPSANFVASHPTGDRCWLQTRVLRDGDSLLFTATFGSGGESAFVAAAVRSTAAGSAWAPLCTQFFPWTAPYCGSEGPETARVPSGDVPTGCSVSTARIAELPVAFQDAVCGGVIDDEATRP
jgi:hypothetical protein